MRPQKRGLYSTHPFRNLSRSGLDARARVITALVKALRRQKTLTLVAEMEANKWLGNSDTLFSDGSYIGEPATSQLHECLVKIAVLPRVFGFGFGFGPRWPMST